MDVTVIIVFVTVGIVFLCMLFKAANWEEYPSDTVFIDLVNIDGENYVFDSSNAELVYGHASSEKYYKSKNCKFIRVCISNTGGYTTRHIKDVEFKEYLISNNYKAYERIFGEKFKTL